MSGGYTLGGGTNKAAIAAIKTGTRIGTGFPIRGAQQLSNAGMQQLTPRGPLPANGPSPKSLATGAKIDSHRSFAALEEQIKSWLSGTEQGKAELSKAWHTIDFNGNGMVSLAEIDRWVIDTFPQLHNKAPLMRAYKASDCDMNSYVTKQEFSTLLRNILYFNKVWLAFDGIDGSQDHRLTFAEFKKGLDMLDLHDVGNPMALFDCIDRNRGGYILFDEFCKWVAEVHCPVDSSTAGPAKVAPHRAAHQKVSIGPTNGAKLTHPGTQFHEIEAKMQALIKDKRNLHQFWRKIDYNGNGLVSLAEIDKAVVEKCPALDNKPALMRAYKATMRKGDGYVHKHEFRTLLRNLLYFNKVYSLYEVVDSNHDRKMDLNEFRSGATSLGLPLSAADAFDEFNYMDANGGGKVLFDEFCKWVATKKLPIE